MTVLGSGAIIAFCGVALDTFRLFEMLSGFEVTAGALCVFIIVHVVVRLWAARTEFSSEEALLGSRGSGRSRRASPWSH